MTYRFADTEDLDQLVAMSDQAKESFKARNIDQWQKGEPNRQVMEASILQSQLHVLEDMGQVVGMITIVPGPEASYASIDGAWLNQEPYFAFHRVCVKDSLKGRGLAARLFSEAEQLSSNQASAISALTPILTIRPCSAPWLKAATSAAAP